MNSTFQDSVIFIIQKSILSNPIQLQFLKKFVTQNNFSEINMAEPKTLSATQIRYLRIGPRANQSRILKQQLIEALQAENKEQGAQFSLGIGNLNKIPKFGYSQLSKTVNNFGVLINQNFGNSSSLHQMQKFGKLAKEVDKIMQSQKDKPLNDAKKNAGSRVDEKQDKRTFLKSIYNYQGQKIFAVLHSFSLQAIGQNFKEIFPFSYMKLLVSKVGSSKLSRVIESAIRFQTQTVEVNYERIQQKASSMSNSQDKYQNLGYKFQKIGTQFKINLPYLQFSHIESDFKFTTVPANKDILDIINQQFDNVHDIVYKYFDHEGFNKALGLQKNNDSQQVEAKQEERQEGSDLFGEDVFQQEEQNKSSKNAELEVKEKVEVEEEKDDNELGQGMFD